MIEIIVDGYNVIAFDQGLSRDLERKRNRLLQQVSSYQEWKEFRVTVVFDAWNFHSTQEVAESRHGVQVMYSGAGEKADDVIVRITKAKGSSCVVVTSDREVRRVVEKFGAVAISAREFTDILRGLETPVVRVNLVGERETNKKGNPHRLSKTERKRREVIRKLWP